jgi:hypothetical protein
LRCQANKLEIRWNTFAKLRLGESAQAAVQRQQFRSSEPIVKAKIFRKKTNFAAYLHGRIRLTENLCVAVRGFHESQEHFDRSALARAVRSEEAEDFAAPYLEREAANGDLVSKNLAEICGVNGQRRRRRQWFLRNYSRELANCNAELESPVVNKA